MTLEDPYKQFLEANPYRRELKSYSVDPLVFSSSYLEYHGRPLLNFSSSDYLGLSKHPELIARSHDYAQRWGVGSTGSRLVTGNYALYETLEQKLAAAIRKPAALILGAGYQANISVLEALLNEKVLGRKPIVYIDKYCHVSLLANTQHYADLYRFKHNDLTHLKLLLEKHIDCDRPKFIIVESVYSMDGDQADLPAIIKLAKHYNAFLYVDDAHAVGVYGQQGFGLAPEYANDIDMIMGTFSKGLGSYGAYIGCSSAMRDYLINKCRGFIYSTGTSPAVLGAIDAALDVVPQLQLSRQHLLQQAENLREFLQTEGLDYGTSNTQIVPWIIGDADMTRAHAHRLEGLGILGTAIRPPSVSPGKSRIRFCMMAAHSDTEMHQLKAAIRKVNVP